MLFHCHSRESGSPDAVPRIKYGAGLAKLVPVKTGGRKLLQRNWVPVYTGNPGFLLPQE